MFSAGSKAAGSAHSIPAGLSRRAAPGPLSRPDRGSGLRDAARTKVAAIPAGPGSEGGTHRGAGPRSLHQARFTAARPRLGLDVEHGDLEPGAGRCLREVVTEPAGHR